MRSSAVMDNAIYQFGDFTAAADNPGATYFGTPLATNSLVFPA